MYSGGSWSTTKTTVYVYDALGRLAAEYGDSSADTPCARCFLTADPLGSTRLITDESGAARARYDYLPFGQEISAAMSDRDDLMCGSVSCYGQSDAINQKFTAKERDAETGLDFFGARYMSSAQVRFTSPDPLLNSGRPWNPQSWNRYAYALNNPLTYFDPDGLWEWGNCTGGDEWCEIWRERLMSAMNLAQQAVKSGNLSGDEKKKPQGVLDYLGSAGDNNGVKISFESIKGAATGLDRGKGDIVIDMRKIDLDFSENAVPLVNAGLDKTAEVAGTAVHEGTHDRDRALRIFDFAIRTDTPGHTNMDLGLYQGAEERAYENQSFVFKGVNVRSRDALWNPSWAPSDQETMRSKDVQEGTRRSVQDARGRLPK